MISSLLNRGLSKDQIDCELMLALLVGPLAFAVWRSLALTTLFSIAGSDTPPTSVQSIMLYIVTNPQVYTTLRAEICRAVAEGNISTTIQGGEAKQLPIYKPVCSKSDG